jgi:ABC-type multidrug transport system ATPase subunit
LGSAYGHAFVNDHAIPIVTLHRALPRRARALHLPPLDFMLGAGVHAVVGTPADGTLAIAKLVGGIEPPRTGDVIVEGRAPARDPNLRARIGVTLEVPFLPQASRVRDLMNKIDSLRGGETASAALSDFGLAHWSGRKMETLSHREARALELVIAVSTIDPVALALTEPGAGVAPLDRQVLTALLSRAAAAGACVIVITASMSDAVEYASTIHLLERGSITRWVPVHEAGALVPGRGIMLRVEVDLPRLLVAALADDPAVIGIDWDQQEHRSTLSLRGDDVDRLALAIARAATSTGASVRSIAPVAPGLDEVRAASSGLALAAYHAAYRSYAEAPPGQAHGGGGGP